MAAFGWLVGCWLGWLVGWFVAGAAIDINAAIIVSIILVRWAGERLFVIAGKGLEYAISFVGKAALVVVPEVW